ncbi:hypothetical protein [Empedobacter sp.]|uniref:hypothetical protein n=1 Tax=Empedobacter sp. TaxID=1927715 RepID=UPI0028B0247C|nr:hypothetical protein [Empedobacter sp.]
MKYVLIFLLSITAINCNKRYNSISNVDDYSLKSYETSMKEYHRSLVSKQMQKETEILFRNKFYSYSNFFKKHKLDEIDKKSFIIIKDSLEISKYKRNIKYLIVIND